jgi:hypothetical protein
MENGFPENISAEIINGDCYEDINDLHQFGKYKGKGELEEVQTVGDIKQTEPVKNEESEMGIPIQDSEHEPSVAKSEELDGVADQKSVENTASCSDHDDEKYISLDRNHTFLALRFLCPYESRISWE